MPSPESISTSRILDKLCEAVCRYNLEGTRGIAWTFDHMTAAERLAFDLFLVRMRDALAWQPGTTEARFTARVVAMATNQPASIIREA